MRSNRVAAGLGVVASGLIGLAFPLPPPVPPGQSPYATEWTSPDGSLHVVSESSQVGSWQGRRPCWQRQWEWVCGSLDPTPERLYGGIM